MAPDLRPIRQDDFGPLVVLNNVFATELSHTDIAGFGDLVAGAIYAKCTPDLTAFLIAFSHTSGYAGANFRWFKKTTDRFVYVDRIAVAASVQGAGLAGRLYNDLFAVAAAGSFDRICCEVNIAPPNPASDRFHRRLGFAEVGRAELPDQGKTVRYLRMNLSGEKPAIFPPVRTTAVRRDG